MLLAADNANEGSSVFDGATPDRNISFHGVVLLSVLDACRQTLIYEYIILL